ncbi:MAG: 50S ribosomal protein L11 methyltransferase [Cytophagales bacterium]|nr:50S ribosomal protein L11 methyltransferase [Bernardetiaceae bacterium]MDW8211817.1 50S ribosomal protein L11 methyltransferase [Cytophagales bacterium]
MPYVTLTIYSPEDLSEILKAELAFAGFESFLELENGAFETSIDVNFFDQQSLENILNRYPRSLIRLETRLEEKQNWNQLWEAYYPDVIVDHRCRVRAEFHLPALNSLGKPFEYELIITPKMSFGTGHHETTLQMLQLILDLDCKGKKVADFGCGTGILAILALKKGASCADGWDIEAWSVENAAENAHLNGVKLNAYLGTVAQCQQPRGYYDLIFANIHLSVLLEEVPLYAQLLAQDGRLLLSGFYLSEVEAIAQVCQENGLVVERQREKNNWAALQCVKRLGNYPQKTII